MKFIDPHIHMYSRTTDDYEKMAVAGIRTVIEPSFWLGQERTSVDTLKDYWEYIISFEKSRAADFGIDHYCAISINPKEANNKEFSEKSLLLIQDYLQRDSVVALGEIGFDLITKQEEKIFREQLIIADELKIPIIIHTPHINKLEGTKKTFDIIEDTQVDQSRIIVDHNNEDTIELSLSYDVMSGITVYPNTKLSPFRAVNIMKKYGTDRILINSSADWGVSDPLSVPKTALEMESHGFSSQEIQKVLFSNPDSFLNNHQTTNLVNKMKFAFSTNAYRNFTIEESIDSIHKAGYDAVEIMCDIPHAFPPIPVEKINSITNSIQKNSMTISNLNGFMMKAIEDFHHPSWIESSNDYRKKRIEHTKNCLKLASLLGAKTVSTEPGGPKTTQTTEKELELFKQGLIEVIPLAEELKVHLLIEPEPELLIENSNQFLNFIEKFESEFLGLNFDIGHFFCVNEDPAKLIHKLQNYIRHIHLEDISASRKHFHLIPGHGNIDFSSIFQSLSDINYDGYVTVELYPYQENPEQAAMESMKFLNSVRKYA